MFFRGYTITHILDCPADAGKVRVIAEAGREIGDIFPYLNALLPNASYSPGGNTLTIKRGYRLITLYPHLAVMAKIDGEADALVTLAWLRDLVNDAHAHRAEIVPCYEHRHMVGFLDVYRLLPATNCKQCGEATCLAFAVQLLEGWHNLEECAPLGQTAFQQRREILASLLSQGA